MRKEVAKLFYDYIDLGLDPEGAVLATKTYMDCTLEEVAELYDIAARLRKDTVNYPEKEATWIN